MPKWEPAYTLRALWPSVTHGWATPAKDAKEVLLWSREEFGSIQQFVPVSTHLSHSTEHQHLRKQSGRFIYFVKKCIRSFVEVVITVDYVSAYIRMCTHVVVLWLYNKIMITKWRINLNSFVRLEETKSQILIIFQQVHVDNTISPTRLFQENKRFKERHEELKVDSRSGT